MLTYILLPSLFSRSSGWYFRQALDLDTHNKYLLMDNSYERAATVGFRCIVDAAA